METQGFYKNNNGQLIYGPNYVLSLNYELRKETKDNNIYPVDGWYWFNTEDEAYLFFGIEKKVPPTNNKLPKI
jgi:hypothetical protein